MSIANAWIKASIVEWSSCDDYMSSLVISGTFWVSGIRHCALHTNNGTSIGDSH
jgi:hypothetical protein